MPGTTRLRYLMDNESASMAFRLPWRRGRRSERALDLVLPSNSMVSIPPFRRRVRRRLSDRLRAAVKRAARPSRRRVRRLRRSPRTAPRRTGARSPVAGPCRHPPTWRAAHCATRQPPQGWHSPAAAAAYRRPGMQPPDRSPPSE